MAQYPNPNVLCANVIQKMVREAIKITATESASVKVKKLGVLDSFLDAELKRYKEIVPKLARNFVVFAQDFVQICPDTPVKSNFHAAEAQRRVRRR